jgi:hypothetical protein
MVEVVKGKDAVGDIIADPVTDLDPAAAPGSDPYLLVRDPFASQWTSLGTIRAEYADWLRQLVATVFVKGDRPRPTWPSNMQTSSTLSYAGWRQRIALVLPYLENSDPLAAQIAWGMGARGPYATVDTRKGSMRRRLRAGWTIQSSCHAMPPTLSCLVLSAVRLMPRGLSSTSRRHGVRTTPRTSPR